MKTKILRYGLAYGAAGVLSSIALGASGEFNTLIALWSALILLLPPLLIAYRTCYVVLKTFSILAFGTQIITLTFFYLNRVDFSWGHVKPFQFTGFEALPILLTTSFFLTLLHLLFCALYKVSLIGGSPLKIDYLSHRQSLLDAAAPNHHLKGRGRPITCLYTLVLSLFVVSLTLLHSWMFSQGISVVGIEPPTLPYRLSGILYYFTRYISIIILIYFYSKTGRGWIPMVIMLGYSLVIGVSSSSRSSLLFVTLTVIHFAWLDRRNFMLAIAALFSVIGFAIVSAARNVIYHVVDGKVAGYFDVGILQILLNILINSEHKIFDVNEIVITFVSVLARIDGFENLVMSYFYDSHQVSGPFAIVIKLIWQGFVPVDPDLHHIQWQGNTLPEGFVNGGGVLSTMVILGNASVWWVGLASMVVAVTLVILEKSVRRFGSKYKLHRLTTTSLIGFLTVSYFVGNAGSIHFVAPFCILFIVSFLPRLNQLEYRFLRPFK